MPLPGSEDAPFWLNFAVFAFAAVVVWAAGARLTRTLDAISVKTGLGQAFVGMLLLGGITSLPEIANVISASVAGVPRLAVNNLLGSAAINVVLLAATDAAIGRGAITSIIAKPATMMMCTLCMMVLCAVALAIAVGDIAIVGAGVWSIAICALSVAFFGLAASYDSRSPWIVRDVQPTAPGTDEAPKASLRRLVGVSAILAALIFAAGFTLSETGDAIAVQTGLGAGMVGFLLIGLSTSLPELSSIVTALKLRRYEMAFGQVLGTNLINLSLFLLVDLVYAGGPVINELGRFEIASALLALALVGIFLVGLLERRDPKVLRMGYDSLLVLLLFPAGVALLYAVR
jgi:cation:H+ antiporter